MIKDKYLRETLPYQGVVPVPSTIRLNDTSREFSPKFQRKLDIIPYLSPTPVKNHYLEEQERRLLMSNKKSSTNIRVHDDKDGTTT